MKRNAFGQLIYPPHLRFATDGDGGGGDGGGDGKTFTAPATQEALDKIVSDAVARTHRSYGDVKAKAEKWDAHEAAAANAAGAQGSTGSAPAGVSEGDVDKRIADALATQARGFAVERVADVLDKALEGRTYAASALLGLDRSQFVTDDHKVDGAAIEKWVKENTTEPAAPSRRLAGQGKRDANATGGTVQAGRDLFDNEKKPRKD